jgi:hypothetical protein
LERSNRIEYVLFIIFISVLVFPLFYILRFLDDNTLVSWKWVFHNAGMTKIYMAIFCVVIAAFLISRVSIPKRLFLPLLLSLPFFIVLPLWNVPEVILDSSRYFVQAKFLEINGIEYFLREWGNGIHAWTDLPLVPFLYGIIFKILGEYRVFIQVFNSAIFSLTVLATYLLGKELWDDETGFYSGLFLAGIPYLLIQVPLMMVDISAMFLLTLSILMFIKAIKHGGTKNILLSAIVIIFTMLTKYSVWLMLFVIPLISVVFAKGSVRDVVLRSLKVTGIAVTLCLIALLLKYEMFIEQIAILRTYQWPALSNWSEGFISTFFFQSHPFLVILASFGAYRALKEKDKRFLVPVWFAVFIMVLRVERIRYIIPLFPLFTLMASYGLMKIRLEDIRRFIMYCVVGLSLVIVYSGYSPFLKSTSMANLQNAGKFIEGLDVPDVMVYTLPQEVSSGNTDVVVPILDLYTSKKVIFKKALELPIDVTDLEGSPLRFTWEFRMPDFYSDIHNTESVPVIVISSDKDDLFTTEEVSLTYPSGNESMKSFNISSGAFRFKSFVYVYRRSALSVSGQ